MIFSASIEPERLRLERLGRGTVDVFDLYEILGRSETLEKETRHLTMDPHPTPNDTRDMILEGSAAWDDGKAAHYVVYPRDGEDGAWTIAGTTFLTCLWDRREARPGIILRKPFWGRGYSAERAMALMPVAFDRLDLDIFSTAHFDGNEKSRRAIEKSVDRFGGGRDGCSGTFARTRTGLRWFRYDTRFPGRTGRQTVLRTRPFPSIEDPLDPTGSFRERFYATGPW